MNELGRGRAGRKLRQALGGLALSALCVVGCASHSDKTKEIRSALDAGNPRQALTLLNEQLDTKSEQELPEKTNGETRWHDSFCLAARGWLSTLAEDAPSDTLQGALQLQRVNLYSEDVARFGVSSEGRITAPGG